MKGNVIDLGHGIDNRDGKAGINCSEYEKQESELNNSIQLIVKHVSTKRVFLSLE